MDVDQVPVDVWCDLDLEKVEAYEIFRPGTTEWADRVNWHRVLQVMRPVVAELAMADDLGALPFRLNRAGSSLTEVDRQGLESLWSDPIFASSIQITNGGHRITAMRKQGVRWAIVQYYLDAVGDTVDPLHAYVPHSDQSGN